MSFSLLRELNLIIQEIQNCVPFLFRNFTIMKGVEIARTRRKVLATEVHGGTLLTGGRKAGDR
jgi:hypothetical protein